MKKKIIISFFLFASILTAEEVEPKNFQINGQGFIRHEKKNNADYDSAINDKTEFTQTRINVSLKADLWENYGHVLLAPQFSKISGLTEFSPSSTTANSANYTSGSLYDSRLEMHEAYFALKPTREENLYFFVGRQELAYGDHLVLGSVPWHRVGRSFDGIKGRYNFNPDFSLDLFSMTLKENNAVASANNPPDTRLHGSYFRGSLGSSIKSADIYLLKRDGQQAGDFKNTTAYGLRLKSSVENTKLDYRLEATTQQVKMMANQVVEKGEYQLDLEVGWSFEFYQTRLALEYFDSSENYDQLFPTGHKFLGFADQFARRNIKGQVVHLSTKPFEKFSFYTAYHFFNKHEESRGIYKFDGSSLGSAGTSRGVAKELDFTIAYDFTKMLQISLGHSIVMPSKYFTDQSRSNTSDTSWSYIQLLAKY